MTEYDNTNKGALFKNNKRKSDKSPEYNGSINVGGVDYWLSGWVKVSQNGNKFFSLSVQPKEQPSISEQAQAKIRRPDPISSGKRSIIPEDDMNGDSIPF